VATSWTAHSIVPVSGAQYRKSVFSSHAPEVLRWLRAFDLELGEALGPTGDPAPSVFDDPGRYRSQTRLRRRRIGPCAWLALAITPPRWVTSRVPLAAR